MYLLLYVIGTPIRLAVAVLMLFLGVLVFALPTLLARGIGALEQRLLNFLLPSRRRTLRKRREALERQHRMRGRSDRLAWLIDEHGHEEAFRLLREEYRAEMAAREKAIRAKHRDDTA
ncbi:hypothetical protein [Streptomyces murinus]